VIRRDGRLHPGVAELLPRLHRTPGVVQSILTGNLAANARLKLGAFGVDRWMELDIAATGSDHHERTELVPLALEKAEARFGHRFDPPEEVWVIGDTRSSRSVRRRSFPTCPASTGSSGSSRSRNQSARRPQHFGMTMGG
jgi:phosphoglycolate phosphatase